MRWWAAACLLLTGCAVVLHVSPGHVAALAVGHARVEVCEPGLMGTPGGAFLGSCVRVEGGAISTSIVELLSLMVSGAVAYFTGGVL